LTFGLGIIVLQDVSRRKSLAGVNIMYGFGEIYEIVIFVYSVPGYKLDGHWPRCFQISQSVIALHSRLVLRNIVWGK
jgi:hypothetical protein